MIEMNLYSQVNKEALCEVEERFKGKRFKVRNLSWIDRRWLQNLGSQQRN